MREDDLADSGPPARGRTGVSASEAGPRLRPSQSHDKGSTASESPARTAILVLGMHRSGTSALTGSLFRLGVAMPVSLIPPGANNARGYWESSRLRDFHDRVLASAGSSWADWTQFNPRWLESPRAAEFETELRWLLESEYGSSGLFAVKDPRICRFVPFWLRVLEGAEIAAAPVIPFRNPLEVALSLKTRNRTPVTEGLLLWLRHVLDAEADTRGMPRSFIKYERLVEDWRERLERVGQDLKIAWPRFSAEVEVDIEDFLGEELHHQKRDEEALAAHPAAFEWATAAFDAVNALLRKADDDRALQSLDAVRIDFNRCAKIFGSLVFRYANRQRIAERNIERQQSRATKLQAEKEQEARSAFEKEKQLRQLSSELAQAVKERDAAAETAGKRASRLQQELAAAKLAETKGAEALAAAEAGLEDGRRRDEQVSAQLAALVSEVASVVSELEKQRQHASDASAARAATEQLLTEARERSADQARRVAQLEEQLAKAVTELAEQRGLNDKRSAELATFEREIASVALQLEDERARSRSASEAQVVLEILLAEERQRLADVTEQVARIGQELAAARLVAVENAEARNLAETALKGEHGRNAELSSRLVERKQAVSRLEQRLAAAQLAERQQAQGRAVAEAALSEEQRRNARLVERVAALDGLGETARAALKRERGRTKNLTARLAALEEKLAKRSEKRRGGLRGLAAPLLLVKRATRRYSREGRELRRRAGLVAASGLFDAAWYLERNRDVRAAGVDPLLHFVRSGSAEGRNPHPLFDSKWYVAQNADLGSEAAANPLVHFLTAGAAELRDPHPLFKSDWYLERNPDVAASAAANPLQHYMASGAAEQRNPHPLFDSKWYLKRNREAKKTGKSNPLLHFVKSDAAEGFDPHPLFKSDWYLMRNPDVAKAGANPLLHYAKSGAAEGRDPHPLFDTDWYLRLNPEVGEGNALLHYMTTGAANGRDPHPLFDGAWYCTEYGIDPKAVTPLEHFLRSDPEKHLNPCKDFDSKAYAEQHRGLISARTLPIVHFLSGGRRVGASVSDAMRMRRFSRKMRTDGSDPPKRLEKFLAKRLKLAYPQGEDPSPPPVSEVRTASAGVIPLPSAAKAAIPSSAFAGMDLPDVAAAVEARPAKVVVYSCLFGDYDELKEPLHPSRPGERYILFTDRQDITSAGWEIVVLPESLGDLRRTSRLAKMLPHRYLPPHEISIYLDAALRWEVDDAYAFAQRLLGERDIALYPHYKRTCVYAEMQHCVEQRLLRSADVEPTARRYREEGFPAEFGLFENAFIVRRDTPKIRMLDAMWWNEFTQGPHRDQFYLMYALWRLGVEVSPITDAKNFRESTFMTRTKHKYKKTPGALRIAWIVNREFGKGWAYENNMKRLMEAMPYDRHAPNKIGPDTDVTYYFDALIYEETNERGPHPVLRMGGPRPLHRLFGANTQARSEYLQQFEALIALSPELARIGSMSGVPTYLVPNGLDLRKWTPVYNPEQPEFVVGFAGSVGSGEERWLKGYDLVVEACRKAGVTLRSVEKSAGSQIPHDRMREDFYAKISCLVHPVAEGKEGSSNVIMEALASGVPVITTRHCGYHASFLRDGKEVLYADRNVTKIVERIEILKNDRKLRRRLSQNGRRFAELNHDLTKVAQEYRNIFKSVTTATRRLQVVFVPARAAVETTATARLRCTYMADRLSEFFGAGVRPEVGPPRRTDAIVVSQLCSQETLIEVQEFKASGTRIVYDCCDPYYNRNEEVYGVYAAQRFWDLVGVAHLVTVPTKAMQQLLVEAGVDKPVEVLPDGIDYREQQKPGLVVAKRSVVWFGNPGHGNYESAVWALERLKHRWGYDVTVITNPTQIKAPTEFTVEAWKYEGFVDRLREHGLALVSQDAEASYKSENRFVASMVNGVPAISVGSGSVASFLEDIGYPEMSVATEEELARAMDRLSNPTFRRDYVLQAQAMIQDRFGDLPVAKRFYDLVLRSQYDSRPIQHGVAAE